MVNMENEERREERPKDKARKEADGEVIKEGFQARNDGARHTTPEPPCARIARMVGTTGMRW